MLVVAIPKSASTSLMRTLGTRYGMEAAQVMFPRQAWPVTPRFDVLGTYHSDIRELIPEQRDAYADPHRLYKQHIVPTDNNLELLAGIRPVILSRDPAEVVRAYRRAERINEHPPRPAFKALRTDEEWLHRADEIGLLAELRTFNERWAQFEGGLVLRFDDLVADPSSAIATIEQHWGLPPGPQPVELSFERYTRLGPVRRRVLHLRRSLSGLHGK